MRVAQRYGCPAMGGVVEGRKSTVESVEEHRGAALGLRGRARCRRLVTGAYTQRGRDVLSRPDPPPLSRESGTFEGFHNRWIRNRAPPLQLPLLLVTPSLLLPRSEFEAGIQPRSGTCSFRPHDQEFVRARGDRGPLTRGNMLSDKRTYPVARYILSTLVVFNAATNITTLGGMALSLLQTGALVILKGLDSFRRCLTFPPEKAPAPVPSDLERLERLERCHLLPLSIYMKEDPAFLGAECRADAQRLIHAVQR